MRDIKFVIGEFYHIYNRGVDKRVIFSDSNDMERWLESVVDFNSIETIGSIYENNFLKNKEGVIVSEKLVSIVAYCFNDNHYHFLLEQMVDDGIEKFMHRLGTGYAKYFNNKNKRTGSLFQGKFKAKHVDSNEYLLYLSVYINLNNKVHQLGCSASKPDDELIENSWGEYTDSIIGGLCKKEIVLEQFKNKEEYKKYAMDILPSLVESKIDKKELETMG